MKGKYGFTLAGSKLVKTATRATITQYLRLPTPNVNNIGDEMYLQPLNLSIGMGTGVGLPASIGTNAKGKPIIHHISLPKWKDVTKTLYKFKNVVILQNNAAYCLDTIKSKENIKMLKSIGPDKTVRYKDSPIMGNKLIGQLIALKFNMAASELGHTPSTGFRDLVYVGPDTAYAYFVGQTVDIDRRFGRQGAGVLPRTSGGLDERQDGELPRDAEHGVLRSVRDTFVERHQHGRHGHQAGGALEHLRKRRPEQRAGGGAG